MPYESRGDATSALSVNADGRAISRKPYSSAIICELSRSEALWEVRSCTSGAVDGDA